MLKKNKKFTLLLSGLSGALLVSSVAGVALSSCTTTSTSTPSTDVQYSYVIDWNNKDVVDRLIIDNDGLVYSDDSKTTVIAISPKVNLTTVKIPSNVKSIMGYSRVMYKNNASNTIVDQIPSGEDASDYTKVYQSYGAFQNMLSLENVILETGSQLQSIGGLAFSGCTTLKSITGLSNSLDFVGNSAFANCINLASIDISNVVKVGNNAFLNCSSLGTIDLSNAIYIGDSAFQGCSNLSSIGSLEKVVSIGTSTFSSAIKSNANISLKLPNLLQIPTSAFASTQGITKIDLSGNTLLITISDNAFLGSSITEVDLTGCSKLSSIGNNAFQNCTSLTSVYLPSNEATSLTQIGNKAFQNCIALTTVAPSGGSTGFVATSKLSSIGNNFLANTAITSVDLSEFVIGASNSLTPFGNNNGTPLTYIANLNSVKLPNNITTLTAGLFYGSGLGTNGGFSLVLPSSITNIISSDSQIITNPNTNSEETITYVAPFTNSGITSIDMSNVTSYQTTSSNENDLTPNLFKNATKLKTVIIKNETRSIGVNTFQNTTALTSITYPATSNDLSTLETNTNGFVAKPSLTTIGSNAFYNAFSEDSNATVDLSAATLSATAPVAFNNSKIANLILPTNITTINANSFDNMTKLKSVNFGQLTGSVTINKSNFNNTQLTSIDLSNVSSLSFAGSSGTLFNGLPTNCVVSLPSTIGNFSDVFIGTDNNYVTFNYPKGITNIGGTGLISISSGVMSFTTGKNTTLLTNASLLDLSSSDTIMSVGSNTFYGSKLNSLTLPAGRISSNTNIFTAANNTSTNSSNNQTDPSGVYIKANVPFGNNESFRSLNYTNFANASNLYEISSITETVEESDSTTPQTSLFNTTNNNIWTRVAKIINSLSYQTYTVGSDGISSDVSNLKSNMSTWTPETGASSPINTDETFSWTGASGSNLAKVTLNNSYSNASDTAVTTIEINSSVSSKTFIHNGIAWTYNNDGTNITLTGKANMYKATYTPSSGASTNYLVFFNQTTYSKTGSPNTIYYVPSTTPVDVTLTIATKSTTQTK